MSLSELNIITSSTQIGEDFPYLYFEQIDCSLNGLDSCLSRFENYIFNFCLYDNNPKRIVRLNNDVRAALDKQDLIVVNRLCNQFILREQEFIEHEVGFYEYSNLYSITLQKLFTDDFIRGTATGENLFAALFNRFQTTDIKNHFEGFTTTRYGLQEWNRPFLFIPKYHWVEDLVTTCDINDVVTLEICFETNNPYRDYKLLDKIDHTYSYSKLAFSSSDNLLNTVLNWTGNSFEEIDHLLWRGCVQYEIGIQRNVT